MSRRPVTVVGVGVDGCRSLSARAVQSVADAGVLVASKRHHDLFADFPGERLSFAGGFDEALQKVKDRAMESQVVLLASGDPLFYGAAKRVMDTVGTESVSVLPHVSSMQEAFARAGIAWDGARLISVHGRELSGIAVRFRAHAVAGVFTDPKNTPAKIARHLLRFGVRDVEMTVCENLGTAEERLETGSLEALSEFEESAGFNVVILRRIDPTWRPPSPVGDFPEERFARRMPKAGLITKREVRVLTIAKLQIARDSVVWDVGAASGSIAIEAAHLAEEGRVYAIEVTPESVGHCRENVEEFGADNVTVIEGRAPQALADLETPDAVFIGGSKGDLAAIIREAIDRLSPGGRLVVNAITMENIAEARSTFKELGLNVEVLLCQVSRGVPVARYLRYEAQNPIHIFSAVVGDRGAGSNS